VKGVCALLNVPEIFLRGKKKKGKRRKGRMKEARDDNSIFRHVTASISPCGRKKEGRKKATITPFCDLTISSRKRGKKGGGGEGVDDEIAVTADC